MRSKYNVGSTFAITALFTITCYYLPHYNETQDLSVLIYNFTCYEQCPDILHKYFIELKAGKLGSRQAYDINHIWHKINICLEFLMFCIDIKIYFHIIIYLSIYLLLSIFFSCPEYQLLLLYTDGSLMLLFPWLFSCSDLLITVLADSPSRTEV